ncbi:MAG TPA: N-6 DNA methylase [Kiritimatiellia bacterium]|nr:N-6 DNA methylase [Kiritimatiellia bacterium]
MENREIPGILKQIRSQFGLSQEELAAKLGVAFSTLNRWENGKSSPRGQAKDAIAALLEEVQGADEEQPGAGTRRRRAVRENYLSTKSMEQMLWAAACSIRGEKDAPKFKDYILPLVFIKRLSDVFDDEVERLAETYGDRETALSIIETDPALVRFYIPPEARWGVVSGREPFEWPEGQKPKTVGERLTSTMRAIVKANAGDPHKDLSGVIDVVDFNETRNGEREISDAALAGVIESLSDARYRLGLRDVEPDFLGRCYEYLLRKFAEGQGQSAGEFFTPTEVGWAMAYMVRPSQGETVYDYACGSAGLLIKCELALMERELKVSRPLKLYGQELTGSSYAIARMNMVIHDMEGEIVRGNSMTNPKFRGEDGRLRTFDIVVANPMWNQPFDSTVYDHDDYGRFDESGGVTSGKADWAWLQHTAASLGPNGRAAVVLDTGAVTRGSGSRNEDKEKAIRKWFVDHDLIEGVVLLPENLFYNTTAAGIIVLLNRNKMPARKNRIVLVNASQEFQKGRPKNYIPEEGIRRIAQGFLKGKDIERFVRVIDREEAEQNDYNLSPSRYVDTSVQETYRPIPEILEELWGRDGLEAQAKKHDAELKGVFKQMGFWS